jgi:hypothetical protein
MRAELGHERRGLVNARALGEHLAPGTRALRAGRPQLCYLEAKAMVK